MAIDTEKLTIAVDIGGSKIQTGVVGESGTLYEKTFHPLPSNTTSTDLVKWIERDVSDLKKKYPSAAWMGIAIPGLADSVNGVWKYACFSGISDFPIAGILSEKTDLPVKIMNDVNACALGEKMFGCCRDCGNYIWITVSNGIGGAVVLDGEIYEGVQGYAGEIGHFIVKEDGRICPCGHRGCLEAEASGRAISTIYCNATGEDISAKTIAERAFLGDTDAAHAYAVAGEYLGKALSYAVNLLNPQMIVLGGGVAMDAELLLPALENVLGKYVFRAIQPPVVRRTALGYDAAILGAAALAFD